MDTFNFEYISLKILLIVSLIISAFSQGQVDRRKGRNHLLSGLSEIIPLFGALFLMEYYYAGMSVITVISSYILIRFGLFDMFWNLGNGQKINYKGVTPYWYVQIISALDFKWFPLPTLLKWFATFFGLFL